MSDIDVVVTNPEPCHYVVDVTIPDKLVNSAIKKVFNEINKQAKFPGFRPGKVPRKLIEKRFGDKIKNEAKQNLLKEHLQPAIDSKDLSPVTYPSFVEGKEGDVLEGSPFGFSVEFPSHNHWFRSH